MKKATTKKTRKAARKYKKTLLALNAVYANWCELLKENADLKREIACEVLAIRKPR